MCLTLCKATTQTIGFGVRKGLLIKKVPIQKLGALVLPQINLKKVKSSGVFYIKRRGNEKGYCKNLSSKQNSSNNEPI